MKGDHVASADATTSAMPSGPDPASVWDGPAGEHRLRHPDQDDAEVRLHNERLREAAQIARTDRVLDIGCGTGQSTREAARAADAGGALGVDLSSAMLDRARALAAQEGLPNVDFEHADAQAHTFVPGSFDLAMSRFGVMFFANPVAAFGNIANALRPAGRLLLMVWQDRQRNEWASAIRDALVGAATPMATPTATTNPFSLGNPDTTRGILQAAGFADANFADVHEPVYFGRDADAAHDFVLGLWSTRNLLATMEPADADRAIDRLHSVLTAHDTGHGVHFDSRAWIVTARRE